MPNNTGNLQISNLNQRTVFFAHKLSDTIFDMTGIRLTVFGETYKEESFRFSQGMTVYMSFYGQVQGGFICGISEPDALRLIGIDDQSGDYTQYREEIAGFFNEIMNVAVAQTLPELDMEYENLTHFPAIVSFGETIFPDVRTASVNITCENAAIKCGFSLNLASAKIVRKLERIEKSLESTVKLARTDALTNMYNRTFFENMFNGYIDNARKSGNQLSLLLIDIDHFKTINDTYGHLVGDQVLKIVAQSIKEALRSTDIAVRYGGDEILVVLPDTDKLSAIGVAEKIRDVVKIAKVVHTESNNSILISITISVGCAEFAGHENAIRLFEHADANLYKAKKNGRDRIVADAFS